MAVVGDIDHYRDIRTTEITRLVHIILCDPLMNA